jgi:hypothetical protein
MQTQCLEGTIQERPECVQRHAGYQSIGSWSSTLRVPAILRDKSKVSEMVKAIQSSIDISETARIKGKNTHWANILPCPDAVAGRWKICLTKSAVGLIRVH